MYCNTIFWLGHLSDQTGISDQYNKCLENIRCPTYFMLCTISSVGGINILLSVYGIANLKWYFDLVQIHKLHFDLAFLLKYVIEIITHNTR